MSVSSTTYLRMSSFGISEAHYETLRMFVDGTQVLMVQGQNNGYCQVSTCKMCTVGFPPPGPSLLPILTKKIVLALGGLSSLSLSLTLSLFQEMNKL